MPIFEYKCNHCEKEFEKLVFAGEENTISCPKCKSLEVVKKMSATSFMGASMGKCTTSSAKGFS